MGFNPDKCLKFRAVTDGTLSLLRTYLGGSWYFSKNNGRDWELNSIDLVAGDEVFVKSNAYPGVNRDEGRQFSSTGQIIHISGNIMSLVDDGAGELTSINQDYGFSCLFQDCKNLIAISSSLLPATTLSKGCYAHLLGGTGITSIPEDLLPATELKLQCYFSLFREADVTSIPEKLLPATAMVDQCYWTMFMDCKKITALPPNLLPSKNLLPNCYNAMFSGCEGITEIPSLFLPAEKLSDSCYESMFAKCTNLKVVQKDAIVATKVANRSCYYMFSVCENLKEIHINFESWTTAGGSEATISWVHSLPSNGIFYYSSNSLPIEYSKDRIPEGWEIKREQKIDKNGAISIFGFTIPARRKTTY